MAKINGFGKDERLCSLKRIDELFGGGNHSLSAFPVRIVYMNVQDADATVPPVQVLISVSKRRFKHAVDRNRVKRLIREAYRQHKHILWDALGDSKMTVAFIYLSDELMDYATVEKKVVNLLTRVSEQIKE